MAMTDAEFDSYLSGLTTPVVNDPGFWTTVKRTGGQMLGGAGEVVGDVFGDRENALARMAEGIIDRNPSGINSLQDIADKPGLAVKEASGNALTFLVPFLGAGKVMQLMRAGPAAATAVQAALAGLPSLGEIGDSQRETGELNTPLKYGGAAAVGAIENLLGVQRVLGPMAGMKGLGKTMTEQEARAALEAPLKTFGKQWLRTGAEEGLEETIQTPIERFAGGKPVADPSGVDETLLSSAMGMIGGLALGPLAAGGHRAQARGLTRQIDSARETLAAPLESLDQLPAKQSAADFLTTVTANDFGSARGLEFANAQAEAAVQDRDVLLEGIAQKADAETQAKLQTVAQEARQAVEQDRQKQIDDLLKSVQSDVEKAAAEEETARKEQLATEGKQRTERDSGFVQPEMRLPLPTDLLGDPLFSPLAQPGPQTGSGVNEWLSQGLEINQRRQQIDTDAALQRRAIEILDRAAMGFGTQQSAEQLSLLGPRGGVAPGVVPRRVTPKQRVQAAAAAGQITEEQMIDLINDIDQGAKAEIVVQRLEAARGTTRSAPAVVTPSPAQGGVDAGGGVGAARAGGGRTDAGLRSGAAGRVLGSENAPAPVVPLAAETVTTKEKQNGTAEKSTAPAQNADEGQNADEKETLLTPGGQNVEASQAVEGQPSAAPQGADQTDAAAGLTVPEKDWYYKHRGEHESLAGKYPAEQPVHMRVQWLEDAIEMATAAIAEGRPGIVKTIKPVPNVDLTKTPKQILKQLEAKRDAPDPIVSPQAQATRVKDLQVKMQRARQIATILRNDSEAAKWLAAMERAKKADNETEFNVQFQKMLDAEEVQQDRDARKKAGKTSDVIDQMDELEANTPEAGTDYGYEGVEGIDFSKTRPTAGQPATTVGKIKSALRSWFISPEQASSRLTVVQKWDDLTQGIRDRITEAQKSEEGISLPPRYERIKGVGKIRVYGENRDMYYIGAFGPVSNAVVNIQEFVGQEGVHLEIYDGDLLSAGVPAKKARVETFILDRIGDDTVEVAAWGVGPASSAVVSKYKDNLQYVANKKMEATYKFDEGSFSTTEIRDAYRILRDLAADQPWFSSIQKALVSRATGANPKRPVRFFSRDQILQFSTATRTQAFVLDGHAYMVADNIATGNELAVFMHEVGSHIGLAGQEAQIMERVNLWAAQPFGSQEREVYDKMQARMEAAGEVSQSEQVAYAVEEAVKAGVTPRSVKMGMNLSDVSSVQDLVNWFAQYFKAAVDKLFKTNTRGFNAQQLVDLAYGAARESLVKPEVGADATAMGSKTGVDRDQMLQRIEDAITQIESRAAEATGHTWKTLPEDKAAKALLNQTRSAIVSAQTKQLASDADANYASVEGAPSLAETLDALAQATNTAVATLRAELFRPRLVASSTKPASLFDADIATKLEAIEGAEWVAEQERAKAQGNTSQYLLRNVLANAKRVQAAGYSLEDMDNRVIYGRGGYNRYFVEDDGAISPIASSFDSRTEQLAKAKQVLSGQTTPQFSKAATLPAQAQRFIGPSGIQVWDQMKSLVRSAVLEFTSLPDLVRRYEERIPALRKMYDALLAAQTRKIELDQDVDVIMQTIADAKLTKPQTDALNSFLLDSTTEQKWAYDPGFERKVEIDPEFQARFEGKTFTPEMRATVKAIFQHGEDTMKQKRAVFEQLGISDPFKRLTQVQGPYAPLRRWGNYMVEVKSPALVAEEAKQTDGEGGFKDTKKIDELRSDPDNYRISFRTTEGAAKRLYNELQATGRYDRKASYVGVRPARAYTHSEINRSSLVKVLESIKGDDTLSRDIRTKMENTVKDLYHTMMEDHLARQSMRQRKYRAGADEDMLQGFFKQARAEAAFIANMEHAQKINETTYQVTKNAETHAKEQGLQDVVNEMLMHRQRMLDYKDTPVQDFAVGMTSAWQLATSPGYHFANATQVAMKTVPLLAAEFGDYTGAWKHVTDGYKLWSKMRGEKFDWSKVENEGLRKTLETASKMNLIDVGMAEDFDQYNTPRTGFENVDTGLVRGRQVLHKLRQASRWVERANRVTAASAAYNMAKEKGKTNEEAQTFAIRVLEQTQGDFSQLAAPMIIKRLPKFVTQYRKYQLMVAALYVRAFYDSFKGASPAERAVARRMLGYMLAHTSVVGGALGLPLINLAEIVVPALFGDEDEPKDLERMMRDWFGEDNAIADMVLKGLPATLGLDLGAKLSDDRVFSILPYTNFELSKKGLADGLVGLMGPGMAQAGKMIDGVALMNEGHLDKGVEKLMPRGIEDALKGYRLANEGYTLRNGDVLVKPEDISTFQAMLAGVGMPAAELKRYQWIQGQQIEITKFYKEREGALKRDYIEAAKDGDTAAQLEAKDRWQSLQETKLKMRRYFANQPDELKAAPLKNLMQAPAKQREREAKRQETISKD